MTQESNRTTPRLLGLRTLKGALQRLSVTMLLMLLTTATAWADIVTYIDANGEPDIADAIPLGGGGSSLNAGWYYVGNDITYDSSIHCHGDVHIILADGKTMTINCGGNGINVNGSLTIYGQAKGTGTLNATGDDQGIYSRMGTITICGGTVNVTGGNNGISTDSGSITISGGRVTATGENGPGISTFSGTITLGCTTVSDFIYASSYFAGPQGKLKIAYGQKLYDEYDNPYIGDGITILIPDGVTLCSFFPHVIAQYIDAAGKPARCAAIALGGGVTTLGQSDKETWYYVDNDITYNGTIECLGDVHIILADGKTMTINSGGNGINVNEGSLTIYGQAKGTGTLNVTGGNSIYSPMGSITICGGTVNATGDNAGIYTFSGTITISGGRVTATGEDGPGIYTEIGNITLGCTTVSDFIYASSYSVGTPPGSVNIADGQTLFDEYDNPYIGDGITIPDGVTLCSFPHVIAQYIDAAGKPARRAAIPLDDTETSLGEDGQETWYYVDTDITYDDQIDCYGDVHIILADGKTMTITSSDGNGIDVYGSLTIYGQELGTGTLNATGGGDGILTNSGTITICGGTVNVTGEGGEGISTDSGTITISGGRVTVTSENGEGIRNQSGSITISGGRVTVTSENIAGIYTSSGTITLGWTTASDFIYASSYVVGPNGKLNIANGQKLYDEDGTEYSGTLNNDAIPDGVTLCSFPHVNVYDSKDNSEAISDNNGQKRNVFLYGRTLFKDGEWNTLCLPFDVSTISEPLSGDNVQAMILNNSEGSGTGFDASTGVLTLNFSDATEIPAGMPFIIRWGTPDDNPGTTLTDPVFEGVTIDNSDDAIARKTQTSTDGTVSFRGTYAWQEYTEENKSILLLGAENTLYWPKPDGDMYPSIGAFRAYFELGGGQEAREFVLNFGEIETSLPQPLQREGSQAGAWFDLSGRKLDSKPTKKGVYIHGGRKVVIP